MLLGVRGGPPVMAVPRPSAGVITPDMTRHLHRTMQEMTQLAAGHRPFLRGVAINPGTPVHAVEPVLGLADLVLVLAVNPGWPRRGPDPGGSTCQAVTAGASSRHRSR